MLRFQFRCCLLIEFGICIKRSVNNELLLRNVIPNRFLVNLGVTPQSLAIFLRTAFRSRPLESRSVVAAARISSPRVSSLTASVNFAMTSSRDSLSPTDVETCSEAPTPDSGADVGLLRALFPNVGCRNAKEINVGESGHSACIYIAKRNVHMKLWCGMTRGTCQSHAARNRLGTATAI